MTDTTESGRPPGPVPPPAPNATGLARRRNRASRIAEATSTTATQKEPSEPSIQTAASVSLAAASPPLSDPTILPTPSEAPRQAQPQPPPPGDEASAKALPKVTESVRNALSRPEQPFVVTPSRPSSAVEENPPSAEVKIAQVPAQVHQSDEINYSYDPDEWLSAGKTPKQAYVPASIATRFKQMQQTGISAEKIVLNAIVQCADRIPELIHNARGPVHEGGLFPGLEIIDQKGSLSRQKPVEAANSRVQYQLTPMYRPTLQKLARQYNLKLSVLVRLALGDYFKIPVRLTRTL